MLQKVGLFLPLGSKFSVQMYLLFVLETFMPIAVLKWLC